MTAIISSVPALNAIEKGVGATFTLDKAQLALVASVVASPYYSVQANWKSVILNYKSSTLSQTTSIGFDASLVSPTGVFNVATQATDIFEIQTISIVDFQNGYFVIPRSQLTVVDFDVDMTPLPVTSFSWDTFFGSSYTSGNGSLDATIAGLDNVAYSSVAITGDFTFSGSYNNQVDILQELFIGYMKVLPLSVTINPANSISSGFSFIYNNLGGLFNGADGTATIDGTYSGGGNHHFEIRRTSGVITCIIDQSPVFTDNYAGSLYFAGIVKNIATPNVLDASRAIEFRNTIAPANQINTEAALSSGGSANYTASGVLLNGSGNMGSFAVRYSENSAYAFANATLNYKIKMTYEVLVVPSDNASEFFVSLGDGSEVMLTTDPRMSLGVHTEDILLTCNAYGVGYKGLINRFSYGLNKQSGQQILVTEFSVEVV